MSNPYRLRFTEDELPPKRKAKSTEAKAASVPQPPTLRHSEDMRGHKTPKLIHAADEIGRVELHRSASEENENDNVAVEAAQRGEEVAERALQTSGHATRKLREHRSQPRNTEEVPSGSKAQQKRAIKHQYAKDAAKAAREGDSLAQSRYYFYDNWDIPSAFEETMPQVFPETAPGNFTYFDDFGKIVMTTFYPFQWDLNYWNPLVFNDMTDNLLYLANRGVDIVRLDAVPYIWKELGTKCRNLPQVHTLVRIMNIACRVVCPSVLLLGEVVMEPSKVLPYFGTEDRPECDMLYNVTTMATIWHTMASQDVRLLAHQLHQIEYVPANCIFQNYLRCHDDIGWGLDYDFLGQFGWAEASHKKYLNDWFTGKWPGSPSRGELYNDSEWMQDARLCGTTASLCGVEAALFENNEEMLNRSIAADVMLHALVLTLRGIPVFYSGDEIGMLNDYGYHNDPGRWADSRNIHRGSMDWEHAEERHDPSTPMGRIFKEINQIVMIRKYNNIFHSDAHVYPVETGDNRVLGIKREYDGKQMLGLFNFAPEAVRTEIETAEYADLVEPERESIPGDGSLSEYWLEPYGFRWLLEKNQK